MTDKKKHKHEEVYEPQPTAESMPVDGEQAGVDAEQLSGAAGAVNPPG